MTVLFLRCEKFNNFEVTDFRFFVFRLCNRPREMSKPGAMDLASGLGGKIDKDEVLSAVDKYIYVSLSVLNDAFDFLFLSLDLRLRVCIVYFSVKLMFQRLILSLH